MTPSLWIFLLSVVAVPVAIGWAQQLLANDVIQSAVPISSLPGERLREMTDQFVTASYRQIIATQTPTANIFYSPLSIYAAILMAYLGARNETRQELATLLALSDAEAAQTGADFFNRQFLKTFNDVFDKSNKNDANYQLDFANRLCVQENFTVQPDFAALLRTFYHSDVKSYNFGGGLADAARVDINAWVTGVTRGKIANLLPPGSISAATLMVLVNAVYFKSNWQFQFEKSATRTENFFTAPNVSAPVQMMSSKRRMFYVEDAELNAKIVEIPYKSEELSMVVMLPNDSVDALMKKLNADTWAVVQNKMDPRLVDLRIPRFKLETAYDLVGALSGMGADRLFAGADLSGMLAGATNVAVSGVVHKAFVGESGCPSVRDQSWRKKITGRKNKTKPIPRPQLNNWRKRK